MYAKVNGQQIATYPYSIEQLRAENPNTSFPVNMTDEVLAAYGVVRVVITGRPEVDAATQSVDETIPAFIQTHNRWEQQWGVRTATQEEIAERANAKSAEIRAERDQKLTATDWTQVADAPVDQAAWAAYRQALRDIPAQAGFPWTVNWPVAP